MKVLYVTLLVVVVDQLTKFYIKGIEIPFLGIAIHGMFLGQSIPVLGDFLRITFIENPGMAFGIEFGGKIFLTLFSIAASMGILIYIYAMRNEKFVFRFSLALILGGAIGNLIDRTFYGVLYGEAPLFHGKVVDFIDVDFFNITFGSFHLSRFWVFNIADSAVTIGVLLMLLFHRTFIKEEEPVAIVSTESSENSSESSSSTS